MTTRTDFLRNAIALEHEAESISSIGLDRRAAELRRQALNLRGMALAKNDNAKPASRGKAGVL